METEAVRTELELTLVSAQPTLKVPAVLEYRSCDPYAVSIVFFPGADEVSWVFSRDLLDEGIVREAGEGDVEVVPALNEHLEPVVQIRLIAPSGIAVLEAGAGAVEEFVARSFALVASGAEDEHLTVDDAIALLLAA